MAQLVTDVDLSAGRLLVRCSRLVELVADDDRAARSPSRARSASAIRRVQFPLLGDEPGRSSATRELSAANPTGPSTASNPASATAASKRRRAWRRCSAWSAPRCASRSSSPIGPRRPLRAPRSAPRARRSGALLPPRLVLFGPAVARPRPRASDLVREQRRSELGDEQPDRRAFSLRSRPLGQSGVVLRGGGRRRVERFELFAGPFDGVVGLGEVVEVADDSRTRSVESLGSSMWSRTKSLRLPTDFIETVWWKSSRACSERIPEVS